ncbi:MAG: DNA repair protein RadC [Bacteroidales bacterium]|nr:DNA repair protein RadC [Bacteroidales bacterium]
MTHDNQYTRAIKDLAAEDRPREKAERLGFRALTTAELLAILVGSGSRGESVIDLCQRILNANANKLYNLGRRNIKDLTSSFHGIGKAKAETILAALEIARRYREEDHYEELPQITDSSKVYNYIKNELRDLPNEEFWILTLNRAKRVTGKYQISSGGTAGTTVDVKIVLKTVIQQLADSFIAVHNHPSGNLNPSRQDDHITDSLHNGGEAIGIPLLDHIIITQNGYYSYLDNNKIT